MPFDSDFLSQLGDVEADLWPWELAWEVEGIEREVIGVLWSRAGQPLALTWAEAAELRRDPASPGALLAHGVWFGADAGLPFHTQVTRKQAEPSAIDLRFAEQLRDLFGAFGLPAWRDHVYIASDGALNLAPFLDLSGFPDEEPNPEKTGGHNGEGAVDGVDEEPIYEPSAPATIYRQPVTGEIAVADGPQPPWLRDLLAQGFQLSDFEVPPTPELETPGAPRGSRLVRSVALETAELPRADGLLELDASGKFGGEGAADRLAGVLGPLVDGLDGPRVGVVFIGEDDLVTAPRAGWIAPASWAWDRPEELFRTTMFDRAVWAVSFSLHPVRAIPGPAEWREPLQGLRVVGELLGVEVRDHLVVARRGRSLSARRRGDLGDPLAWPKLDTIERFTWPPARQANQRKWVYQHPRNGEIWSGRGTPPPWVRELEAEGWPLPTLLVYR